MPRVSSLTGIPMFVVTNVAAVIISWYLTQRDIWPVKPERMLCSTDGGTELRGVGKPRFTWKLP